MESVLDAIYRETNIIIRRAVLAEYLNLIPAEKLSRAFDICISLEGTETPDALVAFFLEIWGKRDPEGCWKRTKGLFRLVGIEDGWLAFDRWDQPRMTAQDFEAIRSSPFWLKPGALTGFLLGIEQSSLPRKQRERITKGFEDLWSRVCDRRPGYPLDREDNDDVRAIIEAFNAPVKQLSEWPPDAKRSKVAFEIEMRRWLKSKPDAALEIIKRCQAKVWPPNEGQTERESAKLTIELLVIWAKVDLPSIVRWADSLDTEKDYYALRVRGFLMSQVDAEIRERWLAQAKSTKSDDDEGDYGPLIQFWAGWDSKAATDLAIASRDPRIVQLAADGAAFGSFDADNARHAGFEVIKNLDLSKLSEDSREKLNELGWETIMEQWGRVDIGEAARYGYSFLTHRGFVPRKNLIKLFSGDDSYSSDGDMLDRTFCALRVWAAVRPAEMKEWIKSIEDVEMRTALTWLLNNPYGTGPKN